MFDCAGPDCCIDLPDASSWSRAAPAAEAHVVESRCVLRRAIRRDHAGRVAVVSSFGAESAVLLALVAEIDASTPVLFVDTGQHFGQTLAYRDELAAVLGLTDVRNANPTRAELQAADPTAELWQYDPDACCSLRKVVPLERALAPFDAWISGRKRHQSATRAALPAVERVGRRTKINPLAAWSAAQVEAEMVRRALPRHPLSLAGYPSIGCATCTRAVAGGEDPRSGRWAGTGKTECGIHLQPDPAAAI